MKKIVFLIACLAAPAAAQECIPNRELNVAHPAIVRGQPIPLLNRESLTGWTNADGELPGEGWTVEQGVLHRGKKRGGDLYHQHWYRDFELTLEFKIAPGGNSGIKYRVQKYGKRFLGCEFQIQDDKGKDHTKHSTGGLYAVYEPASSKTPIVPMQWHTAKIVVCGQSIQHWLDGRLVVATHSGSTDWLQRVANSKFRSESFFGQNREGRIFLQDHGSQVWYRNIVVVPLSCDSAPVCTE